MMVNKAIGAFMPLLWILLFQYCCSAQSLFPDDISIVLGDEEMGEKNMSVNGDSLAESDCDMNRVDNASPQKGCVRVWLEEPKRDSVPEKFQAYACQEHLLQNSGTNVAHFLHTDLVMYIKNESDFELGVCKEEFSLGYDSLEMDIRVSTGKIYRVRRKKGQWYRNFISYDYFKGERICCRLISLDRRLWDGMPELNGCEYVDVRPRFAYFFFVKDGIHYKSLKELHENRKASRWTESRDGELVGDWLRLHCPVL